MEKKQIPLSVIVQAIEETTDFWQQYYNVLTGEVKSLPDWSNAYVDREDFRETADEIDESDCYVRLPSQRELHEYDIMERFAEEKNSGELFRALRGRKPFRNFKDRAIENGLEEEYYAFRTAAYWDIAREWCEENEIPFQDDEPGKAADLQEHTDSFPITVNLYYAGTDGAARRFAEEMESSGVADAIRAEEGNLRYEYFFPMKDPETVLLIDSWQDQAALDAHHASPMMAAIAALREKYDLHMTVERFVMAAQTPDDERFMRK